MIQQRIITVGLLVLAVMLPVSCSRKQQLNTIKLPATPITSAPYQWAVVNSPQLRVRKGPSTSFEAVYTLWKGYTVQIVDRSRQPENVADTTSYWYYINYRGLEGWVYGHYLTLYDSKARAEQAAKELP